MAYRNCLGTHSELDCILRFETLGMAEEKTFFHCDQVCSSGRSVTMPTTTLLGAACLPACLPVQWVLFMCGCFKACMSDGPIPSMAYWRVCFRSCLAACILGYVADDLTCRCPPWPHDAWCVWHISQHVCDHRPDRLMSSISHLPPWCALCISAAAPRHVCDLPQDLVPVLPPRLLPHSQQRRLL